MTERRQPPRGAAERRDPTSALGPRRPTEESGEFLRPDLRPTTTSSAKTVRLAPPPDSVPRRFSSVQFEAVAPPPSGSGRMIDEELEFDFDADGALELDCLPSSHGTRGEQPRQTSPEPPPASRPHGQARAPTQRGLLPPAPPWPTASAGPRRAPMPSGDQKISDTHAAFVAFAGFGDSPAGLLGTPGYAVRVLLRKRELRGDLARARLRHSHDVGLYEASLRTSDDVAVRNGLVLMAMLLVLAGLFVATAVHLLH